MAVASGAEPLGSGLNGSAAEGPQAGAKGKVLVVAGTHGNECNAPWLLDACARLPGRLNSSGLALCSLIGNPDALAQSRRYLDRDLNRSFQPALLADPARQEREVVRARSLLAHHAPEAADPCLVVIDLHSTTAAMGNCLVVYGRRPADLALAAALQQKLGLPIYLHEGDPHQSGYLAEAWPCGVNDQVPDPSSESAAARSSVARQRRPAPACQRAGAGKSNETRAEEESTACAAPSKPRGCNPSSSKRTPE